MIDIVFFEHVEDAGFSRGYGQKSYFFTLANYLLGSDVYMVQGHTFWH